ncbi:MAG: hypothetical protein LBN25_01120, partial [Christensenellaceae bacterium]|nr:hypothetical protein [Christensenellaceae bacterium]
MLLLCVFAFMLPLAGSAGKDKPAEAVVVQIPSAIISYASGAPTPSGDWQIGGGGNSFDTEIRVTVMYTGGRPALSTLAIPGAPGCYTAQTLIDYGVPSAWAVQLEPDVLAYPDVEARSPASLVNVKMSKQVFTLGQGGYTSSYTTPEVIPALAAPVTSPDTYGQSLTRYALSMTGQEAIIITAEIQFSGSEPNETVSFTFNNSLRDNYAPFFVIPADESWHNNDVSISLNLNNVDANSQIGMRGSGVYKVQFWLKSDYEECPTPSLPGENDKKYIGQEIYYSNNNLSNYTVTVTDSREYCIVVYDKVGLSIAVPFSRKIDRETPTILTPDYSPGDIPSFMTTDTGAWQNSLKAEVINIGDIPEDLPLGKLSSGIQTITIRHFTSSGTALPVSFSQTEILAGEPVPTPTGRSNLNFNVTDWYNYEITVRDYAGNTRTETFSRKVDMTPPTITTNTVTYAENNVNISSSAVTNTWRSSDIRARLYGTGLTDGIVEAATASGVDAVYFRAYPSSYAGTPLASEVADTSGGGIKVERDANGYHSYFLTSYNVYAFTIKDNAGNYSQVWTIKPLIDKTVITSASFAYSSNSFGTLMQTALGSRTYRYFYAEGSTEADRYITFSVALSNAGENVPSGLYVERSTGGNTWSRTSDGFITMPGSALSSWTGSWTGGAGNFTNKATFGSDQNAEYRFRVVTGAGMVIEVSGTADIKIEMQLPSTTVTLLTTGGANKNNVWTELTLRATCNWTNFSTSPSKSAKFQYASFTEAQLNAIRIAGSGSGGAYEGITELNETFFTAFEATANAWDWDSGSDYVTASQRSVANIGDSGSGITYHYFRVISMAGRVSSLSKVISKLDKSLSGVNYRTIVKNDFNYTLTFNKEGNEPYVTTSSAPVWADGDGVKVAFSGNKIAQDGENINSLSGLRLFYSLDLGSELVAKTWVPMMNSAKQGTYDVDDFTFIANQQGARYYSILIITEARWLDSNEDITRLATAIPTISNIASSFYPDGSEDRFSAPLINIDAAVPEINPTSITHNRMVNNTYDPSVAGTSLLVLKTWYIEDFYIHTGILSTLVSGTPTYQYAYGGDGLDEPLPGDYLPFTDGEYFKVSYNDVNGNPIKGGRRKVIYIRVVSRSGVVSAVTTIGTPGNLDSMVWLDSYKYSIRKVINVGEFEVINTTDRIPADYYVSSPLTIQIAQESVLFARNATLLNWNVSLEPSYRVANYKLKREGGTTVGSFTGSYSYANNITSVEDLYYSFYNDALIDDLVFEIKLYKTITVTYTDNIRYLQQYGVGSQVDAIYIATDGNNQLAGIDDQNRPLNKGISTTGSALFFLDNKLGDYSILYNGNNLCPNAFGAYPLSLSSFASTNGTNNEYKEGFYFNIDPAQLYVRYFAPVSFFPELAAASYYEGLYGSVPYIVKSERDLPYIEYY